MLLHMEDFVNALNSLIKKEKDICDMDIYNITRDIYFQRLKTGERFENARMLKRAMRSFSRILFGDESVWEKEYEMFTSETHE